MSDRTSKALLALTAAGLWANVIFPTLKVSPARADSASTFRSIDSRLSSMGSNLSSMVNGNVTIGSSVNSAGAVRGEQSGQSKHFRRVTCRVTCHVTGVQKGPSVPRDRDMCL